MADEKTAQERNRRFLELMKARALAQAGGEVSTTSLDAAHARNAQLRALAQRLSENASSDSAQDTPPRRVPKGFGTG